MPESNRPEGQKNESGSNRKKLFSLGFWLIVVLGLGLLGFVVFISFYPQDIDSRLVFFMGSLLNALVFMAIVVQAYIYHKQREVMQGQLRAMQEQLDHNERAFEASWKLGMEQLKSMQEQLFAMEKQAIISETQMQIAAEAVKVSERSIEIAQENTIYAQRAYVTVPSGSVTLADDVGLFRLKLVNSGNTPANEVRIFAVAEVRSDAPPYIDMREAVWTTFGVIAPRESATRLVGTKSDISAIEHGLMKERKANLYVWGAIEYRDVFKQIRQNKFCFELRFGSQIGPCANNNEAT